MLMMLALSIYNSSAKTLQSLLDIVHQSLNLSSAGKIQILTYYG